MPEACDGLGVASVRDAEADGGVLAGPGRLLFASAAAGCSLCGFVGGSLALWPGLLASGVPWSAVVATSPAAPPNTTAAATVAITYPRKVFGSPLFRLPARAADGALPP
ncbi:hypothetical protein [Streptomyces sp. NBC_01565]|uniref:hypothetical protein n=1 Tax=Streptomyces sp. NBC_01565 TaxID=2975881 RepID=UPI002259130C|nr:hypothetical protein [Streptomyces sp. NBC_01565]MCX4546408.1 hypothetical protein [Streptomyces sp. NBC_01565]